MPPKFLTSACLIFVYNFAISLHDFFKLLLTIMNHLNVNMIVDKSSNGGGGGGEERGAGDFEETEWG